jgi:hypothetical protein
VGKKERLGRREKPEWEKEAGAGERSRSESGDGGGESGWQERGLSESGEGCATRGERLDLRGARDGYVRELREVAELAGARWTRGDGAARESSRAVANSSNWWQRAISRDLLEQCHLLWNNTGGCQDIHDESWTVERRKPSWYHAAEPSHHDSGISSAVLYTDPKCS